MGAAVVACWVALPRRLAPCPACVGAQGAGHNGIYQYYTTDRPSCQWKDLGVVVSVWVEILMWGPAEGPAEGHAGRDFAGAPGGSTVPLSHCPAFFGLLYGVLIDSNVEEEGVGIARSRLFLMLAPQTGSLIDLSHPRQQEFLFEMLKDTPDRFFAQVTSRKRLVSSR